MKLFYRIFQRLFWRSAILLISKRVCKKNSAPKRIVFLRYGFLGDVLLTTPAIRMVNEYFPSAKIDYWVSRRAQPALHDNPRIHAVLDADEDGPLNIKNPLAVLKLALKIRKNRYDMGFSFAPDPLWGFILWLCGIPRRIGLITCAEKSAYLTDYLVVPEGSRRNNQELFIQLLSQAGIVGVTASASRIELCWNSADELRVAEYIGGKSCRLIALFPGGGANTYRPWANRKWSAEKWIDLGRKILQQFSDSKLILFGTDSELEIINLISKELPSTRIVNCINKFSFNQLGPLLKGCQLLVSNDSSPVFVAAAVSCPIVVIYGPEWPERTKPLVDNWVPVFKNIDCRERCASFRKPSCCHNECLKDITADDVFEKVIEIAKTSGY